MSNLGNFIQRIAWQPDVVLNDNEPGENFVCNKDPSLAGNTLVCVVAYPNGATPAITDNKGNTWPASGAAGTVTADAGAGNMVLQSFVLYNAATGTNQVTVGFGGNPQIPVRIWLFEIYNITSGTLQGHNSAAAVNASGTVSPGAFTPSQANCQILSFMADSNTSGTTNPALITAAAGYSLTDADISCTTGGGTPSASQTLLQGTAASTTASFSLTTGGTETYNVIAFALPTGTTGTAPVGIHVDAILYFSSTSSVPTSWKFQIPSTGNLGLLLSYVDPHGTGAIVATDSDSVTWTNSGQAGGPLFLERDNMPASSTRTITITEPSGLVNNMWRYFDISGAATAPFDKTAFGAQTNANNLGLISNYPSITPSTANGLVICGFVNGFGPTVALTSPSSAIYDEEYYEIGKFSAKIDNGSGSAGTTLTVSSTTWGQVSNNNNTISGAGVTAGTSIQAGSGPTYTIQPSQLVTPAETMFSLCSDSCVTNWGCALAHIYNPNTSAINFNWTFANQPSNTIYSGAIAFKAAPPAAGQTLMGGICL